MWGHLLGGARGCWGCTTTVVHGTVCVCQVSTYKGPYEHTNMLVHIHAHSHIHTLAQHSYTYTQHSYTNTAQLHTHTIMHSYNTLTHTHNIDLDTHTHSLSNLCHRVRCVHTGKELEGDIAEDPASQRVAERRAFCPQNCCQQHILIVQRPSETRPGAGLPGLRTRSPASTSPVVDGVGLALLPGPVCGHDHEATSESDEGPHLPLICPLPPSPCRRLLSSQRGPLPPMALEPQHCGCVCSPSPRE